MTYEITAHYSEHLFKKTTRRFLRKFLGWHIILLWLATLALFGVLLTLGERGPLMGAAGTILALVPLVLIGVRHACCRRAINLLRKMETPQMNFTFDDDGISARSDVASGHIKWRAVEKLWCFREAYLIFLSKNSYWIVPDECLSDEIKHFITNRLKQYSIPVSPA